MRPQHLGWGQEIVRVVLHERTAAVEARGHHLDDAHKHRRLPVTFRSEAVAILHQPLHGDTGKLAERAEILESVGEGLKTASLKEGAEPNLDPRRLKERRPSLAGGAKRRGKLVLLLVKLRETFHLGIGCVSHRVDESVDAISVHRHSETHLRLKLVPLGDRHVSHVVTKPRDPQTLRCKPATRRAGPGTDAALHRRLTPVAYHGLAPNP